MTEFDKIATGMFVMFGLLLGGLWLGSGSSKPTTFDNVDRSVSAAPTSPSVPKERYYQDRHGKIVSEKVAEEGLERLRNRIRSMPDIGERAYLEGFLRALEDEWAQAKARGPVEPLRVTDGKSEYLIGEAPLPESKRRQIFYELVQAQDSGIGDREAYTLVAKRHGITDLTANEIAYEGAAKKWPMP